MDSRAPWIAGPFMSLAVCDSNLVNRLLELLQLHNDDVHRSGDGGHGEIEQTVDNTVQKCSVRPLVREKGKVIKTYLEL